MCRRPIELVLRVWRVVAGATERTHFVSDGDGYGRLCDGDLKRKGKDRKARNNDDSRSDENWCRIVLILASLKWTSEWRIQNILEKKTIEMRLGWWGSALYYNYLQRGYLKDSQEYLDQDPVSLKRAYNHSRSRGRHVVARATGLVLVLCPHNPQREAAHRVIAHASGPVNTWSRNIPRYFGCVERHDRK